MKNACFAPRSIASRRLLSSLVCALVFASSACTNDVPLTYGDAPAVDVDAAPSEGGTDAPIGNGDGGDAPDGIDASLCGESVPCCPEDLNHTDYQNDPTIAYPSALLVDLDNQFVGDGSFTEFDGTWNGVTQMSPPVTQECAARFVTDPPSNPCIADSVIEIGRTGGGAARFLAGLPSSEFAATMPGTNVHARVSTAGGGNGFRQIEIYRADGAPLVVVTALILPSESGAHAPTPTFQFGPLGVTRSASPACIATPTGNCRRVYQADDLVITVDGAPHSVHPAETQVLTTSSGRYRVTNRAIIRRNEPVGWVSCADLRPDRWSFEIVRLGD